MSATDPTTNTAGDQSFIGSDRHRSQAEQVEEQAFEARAIFEAYAQTVVIGGGNRTGNSQVGHKTATAEVEEDVVRDEAGKPIAQKEEAVDAGDAVEPHSEVVAGTKLVANNKTQAEKAAHLEAKRKRDELVAKMAKGTETGLGSIADMVEILQKYVPPVDFFF